jgi:nucleotide-binding universal stress UspA family protein
MAQLQNGVTLKDMAAGAIQKQTEPELPGAREIVVGYDGGPAAAGALWLGGLLARQSGAQLTIVSVYAGEPAFHAHTDHLRLVLAAEADEHLEGAMERLPYGFKADQRAIRSHSVPNALHDVAAADSVNLIVLGRRPLADTALGGSVAERLVASAPRCGVAVVPESAANRRKGGLRVIGVAYDGTPEAAAALATAERIALAARATLHITGVLEPASWLAAGLPALAGFSEPEERARGRLGRALAAAVARAAPDVCALSVLATGAPAEELTRQATDLDLLVVGSRGYGPAASASLGSVSAALLARLPCPILIVPRPEATVRNETALTAPPVGDRDQPVSELRDESLSPALT